MVEFVHKGNRDATEGHGGHSAIFHNVFDAFLLRHARAAYRQEVGEDAVEHTFLGGVLKHESVKNILAAHRQRKAPTNRAAPGHINYFNTMRSSWTKANPGGSMESLREAEAFWKVAWDNMLPNEKSLFANDARSQKSAATSARLRGEGGGESDTFSASTHANGGYGLCGCGDRFWIVKPELCKKFVDRQSKAGGIRGIANKLKDARERAGAFVPDADLPQATAEQIARVRAEPCPILHPGYCKFTHRPIAVPYENAISHIHKLGLIMHQLGKPVMFIIIFREQPQEDTGEQRTFFDIWHMSTQRLKPRHDIILTSFVPEGDKKEEGGGEQPTHYPFLCRVVCGTNGLKHATCHHVVVQMILACVNQRMEVAVKRLNFEYTADSRVNRITGEEPCEFSFTQKAPPMPRPKKEARPPDDPLVVVINL